MTGFAQMTVAPGSIVKDFDVIEDIGPGQTPGFVDALTASGPDAKPASTPCHASK